MKKILIVSLLFLTTISFAQIFTQKVSQSETYTTTNGVVYALPEVVICLDVWVEKTEFLAGPYASYADELLGLSNVISSNSISYDIGSIELSSQQIADPNQLYFMDLGELSTKSDNVTFLKMNETGLFAGLSSISSTESISKEKVVIEKTIQGEKEFHYFADANLVHKIDTIIRRVDIDTATIERAFYKHYTIEKDMSQRAEDAATILMTLRQNRIELISGYQEVAFPTGTVQFMSSELKNMEDAYLKLFTGKTVVSDEHYIFYYTPSASQSNIIDPVFKFSKELGLKHITSGGGEKVSVAIKSSGLSEKLSDADVSNSVNGVVYRFPETAEVWVKYGANEYDKQLMQIPQLGKLQIVNPGQSTFELHPKNGGLKVLEIRR